MQKKNALGIMGIDHIHFYVSDLGQTVDRYVRRFNFGISAISRDSLLVPLKCSSYVLSQNRINFVITEPDMSFDNYAVKHVYKHGSGVRDVAFLVEDARVALQEAKRRGAQIVVPWRSDEDENGVLSWGTIAAYGDVVHTFVERKKYNGFAPGYTDVDFKDSIKSDKRFQTSNVSLLMVDHVVANVENMREWVSFYENVFGFKQTQHFDIRTKSSALMSMVLEDELGYIKLPINEPFAEGTTGKKDQIQEYLDDYNGPGVQHIALLTNDIIPTIQEMKKRGEEFITPKAIDEYYDALPARVGQIDEGLDDLKETNILVDRESESAYLLQIFTKRHPFFEEIIQRKGDSIGFGQGNFQALFEAIEEEQKKRGTL